MTVDSNSEQPTTGATSADVIRWANARKKKPKVRKGFQSIPEGGLVVEIERRKKLRNSGVGNERIDLADLSIRGQRPINPEEAVENL